MQIDEVIKSLRYSKASIYRLMGEGKFPKSINLGGRSVFWVRSEIQAFILEQIEKGRGRAA
jgi:prophage regulatory protein